MIRRLANHHIHSSGESNGEIKPVALVISDKLKASESQPDSQSVSQ